VSGVNVHGDVGQVEALQSIGDALTVAGGRLLASLNVGVGDQVGQTVWLNDQGDGRVGVLLEDSDDGWSHLRQYSCSKLRRTPEDVVHPHYRSGNSRSMYSFL
jgi:hypothetical protein